MNDMYYVFFKKKKYKLLLFTAFSKVLYISLCVLSMVSQQNAFFLIRWKCGWPNNDRLRDLFIPIEVFKVLRECVRVRYFSD